MKRNASSHQTVSLSVSKQPLLDPDWQTQARNAVFPASYPAAEKCKVPATQASHRVVQASQNTPLETERGDSCSQTLPARGPRSVDHRPSRRTSGTGEVLRGNHPTKGRNVPEEGWRGTRGGRPDRPDLLFPPTRTVAILAVPPGANQTPMQTKTRSKGISTGKALASRLPRRPTKSIHPSKTTKMIRPTQKAQRTRVTRGRATREKTEACYSLSSQPALQNIALETSTSDWLSYAFMGVMLACTFLV